jgi:hypothetical protein
MTKRTEEIRNTQDIIDSRDVIARIEYLEDLKTAAEEDEDAETTLMSDGEEVKTNADFDTDEYEELKALQALADEASGYAPDWQYGEALIRDSYFTEYAQELAEDIGAVNCDASWPNQYIDWERAADALKADYTSVDFDGVDYWVRS